MAIVLQKTAITKYKSEIDKDIIFSCEQPDSRLAMELEIMNLSAFDDATMRKAATADGADTSSAADDMKNELTTGQVAEFMRINRRRCESAFRVCCVGVSGIELPDVGALDLSENREQVTIGGFSFDAINDDVMQMLMRSELEPDILRIGAELCEKRTLDSDAKKQ